jgi:DNA-binding transcriptional regulator YhcF (GntR family)
MATKNTTKTDSKLTARWGKEAIAPGFVALPNIILEKQHALSLTPTDVNIILHIAKHWFEPGDLPHPSKGSIAKAMGIEPRTVQRRIAAMEELGFITRKYRKASSGGNAPSEYDLQPLIEKVKGFANEEMDRRAKVKAEKAELAGRKRAKPSEDDQ